MTPAKSPEYITRPDCKDCRDSNRWRERTVMTIVSVTVILVGWSLWYTHQASATAAVMQSKQAGTGKDIDWIKKALERIEEQMDRLHLAGGE